MTNARMARRRLRRDEYTVGWVCALPIELAAAQEMLDEEHEDLEHDENDNNLYSLGRIGDHNIVVVCLPAGLIGNNPAAVVATQMKATFRSVRFGLMVGIGGGVPSRESDIRLGDVVISQPCQGYGGVIQYDFVKATPSGFQQTGFLNSPPQILLSAIAKIRANHLRRRGKVSEHVSKLFHLPEFTRDAAGPDVLFEATYTHEGGPTCHSCRSDKRVDRPPRGEEGTVVHYGTIASGNQVMRDAAERDRVSAEFGGVLCFEMEAAGLMNSFPCLVIRGICDYSDSHKNKKWQAYAAGISAACAKEVLSVVPPADVAKACPLDETIGRDNGSEVGHGYKDFRIGEGAKAHPGNMFYFGLDSLLNSLPYIKDVFKKLFMDKTRRDQPEAGDSPTTPPKSDVQVTDDMVKLATIRNEGCQSVTTEMRRWTNEPSKSTIYRGQDAELLPTLPRDPVEVALRLIGLPNIESARKAMKSCLKTLDLEDDAGLLLEGWGVTNQEATKEQEKINRRIKDAYRGAATRCRQSLAFRDMIVRQESIARPENETCQWIYQASQYKRWITNDKSLLWIKGNPGSGKSILMKSLFKQRQHMLEGSSTILLGFFFNGRGSGMERSREALYRTLLYALICANPLLLCEVLALYLEKETRGNSVRWQTTELADVFHDKLEQFQSNDIEILIDALDECSDADVFEVVRMFEKSIQVHRNYNSLRVCWSSRFYPNISLLAVQGIELVVNENNTSDIREYIQKVFPMDSHESLRSVGEDIISRAKGVFLWASLVAKKLITAFNAGKDADQLKAMLNVIPDALDNYFLEIFNELNFTTEQREDLQRIALFVLGALRPLSVEELYTALPLERPNLDWSFSDITLRLDDIQQFKKRLTHASGGLIEAIDVDRFSNLSDLGFNMTTRVQVIHESVREFFLGKGLPVLHASSRETFLTRCHSRIIRAGFNSLSKIATDLDITKHHQGNERSSANDKMLNSLVPHRLWRPPQVVFLVNYVQDYVFAHFDHVRCALIDERETTLFLPPATVCKEALYAYLRIGCFEVIQHGGLKYSMNQQLRIVSKHAEAFELDNQAFADLLDFPNRLMASSEFLKRRGIFLFDNPSSISPHAENMHRFLAVFSAGFQYTITDSLPPEVSAPVLDKNLIATLPDIINSAVYSLSPSEDRPENFSLLFGISFFVPTSMARRLMLQCRLSSPDPHSLDREDVIFAVDIADWQVISVVDPDLYSLPPNCFQIQPRGLLTFSTPSVLACRLFHWASDEDASSKTQSKPVFVQAGECALSWQGVPNKANRQTLFEELERPIDWAVKNKRQW